MLRHRISERWYYHLVYRPAESVARFSASVDGLTEFVARSPECRVEKLRHLSTSSLRFSTYAPSLPRALFPISGLRGAHSQSVSYTALWCLGKQYSTSTADMRHYGTTTGDMLGPSALWRLQRNYGDSDGNYSASAAAPLHGALACSNVPTSLLCGSRMPPPAAC